MGFDIYGIKPSGQSKPDFPINGTDKDVDAYFAWQDATKGSYYRQNMWGWRPVWEFVTAFCDDILTFKNIEGGWFNDSHKISKTKANRIANRIYSMDKKGLVKKYVDEKNNLLDNLPLIDCNICEGTGHRREPPLTGAGDSECNGCRATGKKKNWATHYPSDYDSIIEFAEFCKHSGGFIIC